MAESWQKMAENGRRWQKIVEDNRRWQKVDRRWQKMVKERKKVFIALKYTKEKTLQIIPSL